MECPVCLKTLKKKQCINPCEHELCSSCFKKIANKRCPLCRCEMLSLQTKDARLFSTKYIMVKTTKKDKIISLKNLKKHVFSSDFKNYLREILMNNRLYVIKRIMVSFKSPNQVVSYSPENLSYYNLSELFYMYETNILRYFKKPNVINYLIMNIKNEIENRIKNPLQIISHFFYLNDI